MADKKYKDLKFLYKFSEAPSKKELFDSVADDLLKKKYITSKKEIISELEKREKLGSTNFNRGFSIPHIQSSCILSPVCYFVSFKKIKELKYDRKKPVQFSIFLLFPKNFNHEHIEILSRLSEYLLNRDNLKHIYNLDKKELERLVSHKYYEKSKLLIDNQKGKRRFANTSKKYDQSLYIVAVTSCPSGLSQSFLAGKSLSFAAKILNQNIKCEYHAADGIHNELSRQDIANADVVIVADGKKMDLSRFDGKKIYRVSPQEAIKNGKGVIKNIIAGNTKTYRKDKLSFDKTKDKIKFKFFGRDFRNNLNNFKNIFKQDLFRGLTNGVSWMVPVLLIGGIFLGVSIVLGGIIFGNLYSQQEIINMGTRSSSFVSALYRIGVSGLNLIMAVLGGFVAVGIAGKVAFAPGFVISWTNNWNSDGFDNFKNPTLFDYSKDATHLGFGVHNGQLGFIGAIIAGMMAGYITRYINNVVSRNKRIPKMFTSTLFITIFVTVILWAFFAFIISAPIVFLLIFFEYLLKILVIHKIFVLIGILMGVLITIDMGGPLNKTAYFFVLNIVPRDLSYVQTNIFIIMLGIVTAIIAVPPLGMALYSYIGKKFNCSDEEDKDLGRTAFILGIFGITEGAIPFGVKYPKSAFISNIAGGITAGFFAAVGGLMVSSNSGSVFTYLLGDATVGHFAIHNSSAQYLKGLYFVFCLGSGVCVTAFVMLFLNSKYYYNDSSNSFGFRKFIQKYKIKNHFKKINNPQGRSVSNIYNYNYYIWSFYARKVTRNN